MWVNLSPYEENRIIPESFGQTEMGRDLLAQDYILKQLAASLMFPEDELGKEFWHRVRTKAQEQYGTTEIPMNTFNKIWILPEKAVVYEYEKGAFVVESRLDVMLEEDYLALEMNQNSTKHGLGDVTNEDIDVISGVTAEIVREILIPEIKREVNEGKHFTNLRQIYNAMVLATWYKHRLKRSLLGQVYVDQKKTQGIQVENTQVNQEIYEQYIAAFKKGVYNYIKEEVDQTTQEVMPRKYFSGGASAQGLSKDLAILSEDSESEKIDRAQLGSQEKLRRVEVKVENESFDADGFPSRPVFKDKTVLIQGAGGTGSKVIDPLLDSGTRLIIIADTNPKAIEDIQEKYSKEIEEGKIYAFVEEKLKGGGFTRHIFNPFDSPHGKILKDPKGPYGVSQG